MVIFKAILRKEFVYNGLMRHVAMLSVCGDAWFNLCTLMTECETGVQQTRPGAAA